MTETPDVPPGADAEVRPRRTWWWVAAVIAWIIALPVVLITVGLRSSLIREYGGAGSLSSEVGEFARVAIPAMVLTALAVWLTLHAARHWRWGIAAALVAAAVIFGIGFAFDYQAYSAHAADPSLNNPSPGVVAGVLKYEKGHDQSSGPVLTRGTVTFDGPTTVKVKVDDGGQFQVSLPSGTYQVTGVSPDFHHGKVECSAPGPVTVEDRSWQLISVFCKIK